MGAQGHDFADKGQTAAETQIVKQEILRVLNAGGRLWGILGAQRRHDRQKRELKNVSHVTDWRESSSVSLEGAA